MATKGVTSPHKKEIDLNLMKKLYYEDKFDYKQLANYFGFKSKSAIYDRFKALGLRARDNTDLKTGFKHSEETKKKIKISCIGKKHTEESKKKMSYAKSGKNNCMYGKYGKKALNYKGGCITPVGYRMMCDNYKMQLEHRIIWEKVNGKIPEGMEIHHINKDKLDNRIENLQLLTSSQHSKLHKKQRDNKGRFLSN